MRKIYVLLFLIMNMVFAQFLSAQNHDTELTKLVDQIVAARKTSNELLLKYTWTSRVEILKSKEILNIMIEKNNYNQNGLLVQKVINEQGAKMPTAFLIKEIAESEKENMEKFLYGLKDFLKKYSLPLTDQVTRFLSSSSWQLADSVHAIIFKGKNVEEQGDELIWWVEDMNYSTSKIEVSTVFEGDSVHFSATFGRRSDGLNYMAYAAAYIPAKNITLLIQNYDFTHE